MIGLNYTYQEYVDDVLSGKITVCRNIRLACERFERQKNDPRYYFDEEDVKQKIRIVAKLKHTTGSHNGKPFILLPYQQFIIAAIFGIKDRKTNLRITRKVFLMLSRKQGKTALAAYLAVKSEFPFVKFISADMLLGNADTTKAGRISAIFQDAYKSPLSMIILDDLERLVEYVRLGPRFSNAVLQALLVLIKKVPPTEGRKLMIVATTSQRNAMEELGLMDVSI